VFDYATGTTTPHRTGCSRLVTGAVSAIAHVVVLVAVAIPALYATDVLPEPPDMMAFVVNVAPPPPPPPPPPPAEVRKTPAVKPRPATRRAPTPEPPKRVAAAVPVEAPNEILEETGLEGEPGPIDEFAGFEYGVDGGVPGGVIGGIETVALPPPPPPAPPTPVRVGGDITPPRLTHRVEPEYPLLAQRALIQGIVILEATVDERGRVRDVNPLRSHPVLQNAAVNAVRQWRYQPLVLNGIATPFVLTVTVSFTLAES
jgi:protein TonB